MTLPIASECDTKCILNGIWRCLHRSALRANTVERKNIFKEDLKDTFENLPCKKCQPHAISYLEHNRIEDYDGITFGYFTWTWEFHNSVNKRIGKPQIDWQTAYSIHNYEIDSVCANGCSDDEIADKTSSGNINFVARY